jgi:hypothetical protein
MVRMYVAAARRLAGFAGGDRGDVGPSYLLPTAVLGTVVLVGSYVLRGPFHWLVSVLGR